MRKHKLNENTNKILVVDDEIGIIEALEVILSKHGYKIEGETDPIKAIERVREEKYDLLILDYIMNPMKGDEVVEAIRNFNKDLYILLLTGYKDLVPPLDTIKQLEIQGYCEKSDKFDQLLLWVEAGLKASNQMQIIKDLYSEIEDQYSNTVEALRQTVDTKDEYTRGHSDRVAYYSVKIGEKLSLSRNELEILRVGGLFHDIGKIGISDEILLKKSKLTEDEYDVIKSHPNKGENILSSLSKFKEILSIVKHHHERVNGSGYPDGLKGDEIPLLTKIVAVADTFDAMTSNRVYRDDSKIKIAKDELIRVSGEQLDSKVVEVFIDILDNDFDNIKRELIEEKELISTFYE